MNSLNCEEAESLLQTKEKTVAVVTGSRAEYGLLRPVLRKLEASPLLLKLVVTGSHLSDQYGNTVAEIEADGFPICARIPILKYQDKADPIPDTVAYTLVSFAEWFRKERPDLVLVLGDRYEIFAVAQAAAMTGVPIAHISGGDVTLGAADEYYRHCITKMAALHFPSCQESAQRLIRMGEQPERVFQVGGLGDENIRNMPKLTAAELSADLGFDLTVPFGLVTFHPETGMDCADPLDQMKALLGALEDAHTETGLRYLITKSNADQGGASINAVWDEWTSTRRDWSVAVTSLGVKRYLSAMACAAAVIGNSSSGVVETPSFGVPTVNIGERQNGRPICSNVLCVPAERKQILDAIRTCLDPDFRHTASRAVSPYYGPDPSGSIVRVLEKWIGRPELREPKRFYDPI